MADSIVFAAGSIPIFQGAALIGADQLELRAYSNGFFDVDGRPLVKGSPHDLSLMGYFYGKAALTVSGNSLTFPSFALAPTTNSIDKPAWARWSLWIFNVTKGRPIAPVPSLESFWLNPTPTSTDLDEIAGLNVGALASLTPRDVTVTGNLIVLGTIQGGDAVGDTVAFSGPVTAPGFSGNGAGLTGVQAVGTLGGPPASATSLSLIADSGNTGNAAFIIDDILGGVTKQRVHKNYLEDFVPRRIAGYTQAGLPAAATPPIGSLARVTDTIKGLRMTDGTQWVSLLKTYDAQMYGVKADGATNDSAALQALIDIVIAAGGGRIILPIGTTIASGLIVSSAGGPHGVIIEGQGFATRIANPSATADTITFTGGAGAFASFCGVCNLRFEPSVTRTAGFEIVAPRFSSLYLRDLVFRYIYGGINLGNANGLADACAWAFLDVIRVQRCYQALKIANAIAVHVKTFEVDSDSLDATPILIDSHTEGCTFDSVSIQNTQYIAATAGVACRIQHTLNTGVLPPPRFLWFSLSFLDSHKKGLSATAGEAINFNQVWFGTGSFAADDHGAHLEAAACKGYNFSQCIFVSSQNGLFISAATDTNVNNSLALGNENVGIIVGADSVGTLVRGNRAMNGMGRSNTQDTGIWIQSGATKFIVKDNDARGNATNAVLNNAGTAADKIVGDNLI